MILTALVRGASLGLAITGGTALLVALITGQPILAALGACAIYWGARWYRQLTPSPPGRRRMDPAVRAQLRPPRHGGQVEPLRSVPPPVRTVLRPDPAIIRCPAHGVVDCGR
jgi:hypothetical protein